VKRAIAKKNTLFGAESKFAFIIGAKVRPTSTTKSAKSIIIRSDVQKTFSWRFKIKDFAGKNIDKKSGCEKSFIPELKRQRH
jgi:hypothetical protein